MSDSSLFMLVGLGNPGAEYAQTRHNIGFLCIDYLADKYTVSFSHSKWQADVGKARLGDKEAVLVKPLTFMNRSGQPVSQICNYYRIPHDRVIVVHDDADLEWGRIKIVVNRGAGGHNGIRSIIEQLGNKGFVRVRIGIGRPSNEDIPMASFVLARFSQAEKEELQNIYERFDNAIRLLFAQGLSSVMNAVNTDK
jgi:PTH1 family peptidyl-tRNA hydrolase